MKAALKRVLEKSAQVKILTETIMKAQKNTWERIPIYHTEEYEIEVESIIGELSPDDFRIILTPDENLSKAKSYKASLSLDPYEEGDEKVEEKAINVSIPFSRTFKCPKVTKKLKKKIVTLLVSQTRYD